MTVSHEQGLLNAAQELLQSAQRINGVYTGRTSIMAICNLETVVDIAVARKESGTDAKMRVEE
tara:strand:+ start:3617 stop:3805 length:189 start_codon:yes stop_codon:yes gene_type:complete